MGNVDFPGLGGTKICSFAEKPLLVAAPFVPVNDYPERILPKSLPEKDAFRMWLIYRACVGFGAAPLSWTNHTRELSWTSNSNDPCSY